LGKNIADVDFPVLVGYEGQSEIAYTQDELDGILDTVADQGVAYSLDSLADVEAQDLPVGAGIEMMEKLVIKKSTLSEMIKRTVQTSIREQVVGYEAPATGDEGAESGKDTSDDYLAVGQTSVSAAPDSQKEKRAADTSTRELTQQRQEYLDKGNAVTADDTGRQLQDLLDQKNEHNMKITTSKLRAIIREVLISESVPGGGGGDQTFGANAPHPLLRNSYSGNGWITGIFDGAPYEFAKANAGTNEHMKVLVGILDGTMDLPYVPFIFADELMNEFSAMGLEPTAIQQLDDDMLGEDNEYNPPGW
jgi:hypothetical protein